MPENEIQRMWQRIELQDQELLISDAYLKGMFRRFEKHIPIELARFQFDTEMELLANGYSLDGLRKS